jgi:hypothetical protein
MTVNVSATRVVPATGREVLELVLDLDRYRIADHKITTVSRPVDLDERDEGRARYWGRLPGLPPAPDVNLVRLERWQRVTFVGAPRQPARAVLAFRGWFACREVDDGCEVTHGYEITLRRPLRWAYESTLQRRLPGALDEEMDRIPDLLRTQGARLGGR